MLLVWLGCPSVVLAGSGLGRVRGAARRAAAVELPHPVGLVVVGGLALGAARGRPSGAAHRPDLKRPELAERETPVRPAFDYLLYAAQLGIAVGVVGLLPGLGPLEGDVVGVQYPAQPLMADANGPIGIAGEISGQLAQAPPRERQTQSLRARLGRIDDEHLVASRDPAGTATRPARVQRLHPQLVEPPDHLTHPVLGGGRQPSDHRHRVAPRRRQHHQSPPPAHNRALRAAAAAANNPLKLTALPITQTTNPQRRRHTPNSTTHNIPNRGPHPDKRLLTEH